MSAKPQPLLLSERMSNRSSTRAIPGADLCFVQQRQQFISPKDRLIGVGELLSDERPERRLVTTGQNQEVTLYSG